MTDKGGTGKGDPQCTRCVCMVVLLSDPIKEVRFVCVHAVLVAVSVPTSTPSWSLYRRWDPLASLQAGEQC